VLVVANLQTGSQTGSQTDLQTDLQTFISVFGLLINFMPKVLCITNFNDIFAPRL
jgi:hypothetical protein